MKTILFLVLTLLSYSSFAQISPSDNETLNYTSIVLSFPKMIKNPCEEYTIEIEELGGKKTVYYSNFQTNKGIITNLSFGKSYRWRYYSACPNNSFSDTSSYYRFSIGHSRYIDPNYFTYDGKFVQRGQGNKGVLFFDYGRVATNRAGKPLFYLPELPFATNKTLIRDLKMTHNGTLTALFDSIPCEFTLNGEILWSAPDSVGVNLESSEHYHHEFTKLPNGNFLILGNDIVPRISPEGDTVDVEFGTIIEFDPNGNVVWNWNSKNYFLDTDLFKRTRRDGSYETATHMNACTTDGMYFYAGFRDISRLIVIEKASGKVVASYGQKGSSKEPHSANGFFRRQHDSQLLSDGNFAVVNNDSIMDPSVVSSLVIFSPIKKGQPYAKKLLDFKFNFDTLTNGKSAKTGNLEELPNGNIFVNMGSINRCIEINRKGELVWDLFMNYFDTNHNLWLPFPNYRVSTASSLYPTLYHASATKTESESATKSLEVSVVIYNLGSEADTYTIELIDEKGSVVHKKQISIGSNQKKRQIFSPTSNSFNLVRVKAENSLEAYRIDL